MAPLKWPLPHFQINKTAKSAKIEVTMWFSIKNWLKKWSYKHLTVSYFVTVLTVTKVLYELHFHNRKLTYKVTYVSFGKKSELLLQFTEIGVAYTLHGIFSRHSNANWGCHNRQLEALEQLQRTTQKWNLPVHNFFRRSNFYMGVSTRNVGHAVLSDVASSTTEVELCKCELVPTKKWSLQGSHPCMLF